MKNKYTLKNIRNLDPDLWINIWANTELYRTYGTNFQTQPFTKECQSHFPRDMLFVQIVIQWMKLIFCSPCLLESACDLLWATGSPFCFYNLSFRFYISKKEDSQPIRALLYLTHLRAHFAYTGVRAKGKRVQVWGIVQDQGLKTWCSLCPHNLHAMNSRSLSSTPGSSVTKLCFLPVVGCEWISIERFIL